VSGCCVGVVYESNPKKKKKKKKKKRKKVLLSYPETWITQGESYLDQPLSFS
jgi:hypothetical protein